MIKAWSHQKMTMKKKSTVQGWKKPSALTTLDEELHYFSVMAKALTETEFRKAGSESGEKQRETMATIRGLETERTPQIGFRRAKFRIKLNLGQVFSGTK